MQPLSNGKQAVSAYQQQSILATNTVIRNTYILLSLTLLFSAFTAFISFITNAMPMNPILVLGVYFGLLFAVTALRNSAWGIAAIFTLTGFLGYTLGPLINYTVHTYVNGSEIVMSSLGLTGAIFLGLSGYALATRKDFSYMGGFLMTGMVVLFIAVIGSLFFAVPALNLAISCGFVLLMSGYILFQTSLIIHGGERNYILATLSLYISIYNLFVSLIQILAAFSGRRE